MTFSDRAIVMTAYPNDSASSKYSYLTFSNSVGEFIHLAQSCYNTITGQLMFAGTFESDEKINSIYVVQLRETAGEWNRDS